MSERKVINKYIPADFDPSKIKRIRKPKDPRIESRIMLPMSIQCLRCGEFMYKGKKFNGKKEDAAQMYLNRIKIYRFYIKCTACSNELTFLTDPANSDYKMESGAKRNFEPWKVRAAEETEEKNKKEAEEKNDLLKKLENKQEEMRLQLQQQRELEELQKNSQRHNELALNDKGDIVFGSTKESDGTLTAEQIEDELAAQRAFANKGNHSSNRDEVPVEQRIAHLESLLDCEISEEEEEDGIQEEREEKEQKGQQEPVAVKQDKSSAAQPNKSVAQSNQSFSTNNNSFASTINSITNSLPSAGHITVKRKVQASQPNHNNAQLDDNSKKLRVNSSANIAEPTTAADLSSLLGDYSDSD
jgi:flagellar motility protein MotE (MotC chaperone)